MKRLFFKSKLDISELMTCFLYSMQYLKDSIGDILSFFKSSSEISQTFALETAAAVQVLTLQCALLICLRLMTEGFLSSLSHCR